MQKKFNRNDFLSVGTLLSLLVKNNDLSEGSKLVAYYCMSSLWENDPDSTPKDSPFHYFLLALIDAKDSIYKLNSVERNFIAQLLASGTKEVSILLKKITTASRFILCCFSYPSKLRITSS